MQFFTCNSDLSRSRLIDFFKYFSRDFLYNTGVASIRAGLIKKESKGWQNDVRPPGFSYLYLSISHPNSMIIHDSKIHGSQIASVLR